MRTLFANAILFGHPDSDSILVSEGRISRIGKLNELRGQAERILDLNGGFLCPAFIDAHVHPVSGGMTKLSLDLRNVESKADFVKRISAYAATLKPNAWVKGRNWQADFWPDGSPDKNDLDQAVGGRPALIYRFDGHVAVASSKALELAGIDENTSDPSGGIIGRDKTGKPDGILKDDAIHLVKQKMNILAVQELEKIFEIVSDEACSLGIGTLHSVISLREFNVIRSLSERKKLKCRFSCYVVPGDQLFDEFLENAVDMKNQSAGNISARLLGVKLFYDGAICGKILGPVREKNTYVFNAMLNSGVKMCFGSDWPIAELNPLLGIYSAASRAVKYMDADVPWLPEERISVSEAIKLFTEGSSFAEFAENEKGVIMGNHLADLVLLSEDPRECELSDIPEIKVLKTFSGGEMVYDMELGISKF